jgi:hypothetical protein
VAVILVGEVDPGHERLVTLDQRVGQRFEHQCPGPPKLRLIEIRTLPEHCGEAFVEDPVRPTGAKKPLLGDTDEQVAERSGVEYAGIVDPDESHRGPPRRSSVVETELL